MLFTPEPVCNNKLQHTFKYLKCFPVSISDAAVVVVTNFELFGLLFEFALPLFLLSPLPPTFLQVNLKYVLFFWRYILDKHVCKDELDLSKILLCKVTNKLNKLGNMFFFATVFDVHLKRDKCSSGLCLVSSLYYLPVGGDQAPCQWMHRLLANPILQGS